MYFLCYCNDVAGIGGDELFIIKDECNRLLGYSLEYDTFTYDIESACNDENNHSAKWKIWSGEESVCNPASFNEIKLLGLDVYLVCTKLDMTLQTPYIPIEHYLSNNP